eukprot:60190-Chlamydomonas_euryale.AAC.2
MDELMVGGRMVELTDGRWCCAAWGRPSQGRPEAEDMKFRRPYFHCVTIDTVTACESGLITWVEHRCHRRRAGGGGRPRGRLLPSHAENAGEVGQRLHSAGEAASGAGRGGKEGRGGASAQGRGVGELCPPPHQPGLHRLPRTKMPGVAVYSTLLYLSPNIHRSCDCSAGFP